MRKGQTVADTHDAEKTLGGKLFDIGVYGGIGYVANAAISLAITRYAVHMPHTQLHRLGREAEKGFQRMFDTLLSNPESASYWAKKSNEILFLGSGGWLLLVPMKWLEDHKVGIIQSIDSMAGTQPSGAEAQRVQRERLEDGPRQGYGSLFLGRVVSYVATVTFALPLISRWTNVGREFSLFLDKQLGHSIGELAHPVVMVGEKQMSAFVNALSSEVILAGTSAGLHYVSSKLFAEAGHRIAQESATLASAGSHLSSQRSPAEQLAKEPQSQTPKPQVYKVLHDAALQSEGAKASLAAVQS